MTILYTLVIAAFFGWVMDRLRVPGGMMIGAVIGACSFNILSGGAQMPAEAKIAAQIVAGAFIGSGIKREDIKQMKAILKAAAIVISCLFAVNLTAAVLIRATGPVDFLTALFASAPGGLSDIPIIAADMGADASQVLALQFVRFVMGIAIFPSLIARFTPRQGEEEGPEASKKQAAKGSLSDTLLTLAVAAAFGLAGRASPVPGGTMAFATIGAIIFKLLYPKAWLGRPVRKGAQLLSGAYVGAGIGLAQLVQLKHLALPVVMLLLSYSVGAVLIAALLQRLRIFGRREAFLAATPAGASDMALISADLGVYNVKLVLLQVMRLIAVILLFPSIFWMLAK